MSEELSQRIAELSETLWRKHHAVVDLPEAVPAELWVRLVERELEELQEEDDGYFADCPICQAMKAEGLKNTKHLDFCSGWCPSCEVLEWCPTASENHSPGQIAWMKENGDFPPKGGRS